MFGTVKRAPTGIKSVSSEFNTGILVPPAVVAFTVSSLAGSYTPPLVSTATHSLVVLTAVTISAVVVFTASLTVIVRILAAYAAVGDPAATPDCSSNTILLLFQAVPTAAAVTVTTPVSFSVNTPFALTASINKVVSLSAIAASFMVAVPDKPSFR